MDDAHSKMLTHGRRRNRRPRYLQWTKADFIRDSIQYVLDLGNPYNRNIQNYSILINEMRVVRNHIAHRLTSTRQAYNTELARLYGANIRLPVGAYLASTTRHPISNMNRYIQSMKIILDDITNG
jgi:hypothetical protein